MVHDSRFALAKSQMQAVYERRAGQWDRGRNRQLIEKAWLDRFLARLRPGGRLLELGCGAGEPVGRYFLDQGFELTGLDYAQAMIDIAAARLPQARWLVQDMRALQLDQTFDGVCSWDGFFHLSVAEQRLLLPRLESLVAPGGAVILTVGPAHGEVLGTVAGESVYHASLSPEEYRQRLLGAGFDQIEFVAEDASCGGRSVLLASRLSGQA